MSRHSLAFALSLAVAAGSPTAQLFGQAAAPAAAAPAAAAPAASGEPEKYADPAVQALMDSNPQTPQDLLSAVLLLLDLKQPKPAKILFTKLVTAEIPPAELVALGKKIGTSGLYRLSDVPEFRPQASAFVNNVLAAMNTAARDPDRLAELIERLKEPSFDVRIAAIAELRQGREAAAAALLNVLLDPTRADEHAGVRAALAGLGTDGIEPLAVLAAHGTEAEQVAAITALGESEDLAARAPLYSAAFGSQSPSILRQVASQAIVRRQGKLPSPITAAAELYLEAKRSYLARPTDLDRHIEAGALHHAPLWTWDTPTKRPVLVETKPRVVALKNAARLADIAADTTGRDPHAVTLAQAASLEAAMLAAPVAKPKAAPAGEAPPAEGDPAAAQPAPTPPPAAVDPIGQWNVDVKPTAVELRRLLEFTAANDRPAAAQGVIRLLALAEGVRALDGIGGRPSTLVKLTAHPDRRIRFAAMDAIVGLNPQTPFTGSSAVAEALGYFAASTGSPRALVADPNAGRARDVAGVIASNTGFRTDVAVNAHDAVRMVAGDPDVALIAIYRPLLLAELGQLLAQYRADYRTARIPVLVYCEPNDVERTRTLVANDPLTLVIYQPRTVEQLATQVSGFKAPQDGLVSPEERAMQARRALSAMKDLLAKNSKVFNLRPFETAMLGAAWGPATSGEAIGVLSYLGSPAAQRTLVDLASAITWPIETRTAAAEGFRDSVGRFGTLLTTAELSRQYARYNDSATADKATQEVLGAVLDTIEARAVRVPGGATLRPAAAVKPAPVPVAPPAVVNPPAVIEPPAESPPKGASPASP